jgi:transposase InsO family protein
MHLAYHLVRTFLGDFYRRHLLHCVSPFLYERVIGILKGEYLFGARLVDSAQVDIAFDQAINFYNIDRPHLVLNMASPRDVYYGQCQDIPPVVIHSIEE